MRQTQRRLSSDDVDALVDRYRAGATIKALAEQFAINRTTVMSHLDRRHVERRKTASEWDHPTLTQAIRSYADGRSLSDIAEGFGLSPTTVADRLRRAGVTIRPPRGVTRREP